MYINKTIMYINTNIFMCSLQTSSFFTRCSYGCKILRIMCYYAFYYKKNIVKLKQHLYFLKYCHTLCIIIIFLPSFLTGKNDHRCDIFAAKRKNVSSKELIWKRYLKDNFSIWKRLRQKSFIYRWFYHKILC